MTEPAAAWPDLALDTWAPTKKTLHAIAQMLGKLRLALSPDEPNWMFASLALTARGFTTGPMPYRGETVQATLDVFDSEIRIDRSDGRSERIALVPARTVASIYAGLTLALGALDVAATITTIPQEVADVTPFDADHRPPAYEPAAVQRWLRVMAAVEGVFAEWRAPFFGRSGIQLWWGALDFALLLFNGKHVPAPADRGYLLKYDLDAEMMNAGFYPGDDSAPAPFFYGYIYPQPDQCALVPIAPAAATWSTQISEWVLPYEAVRTSSDPAATLRTFLDSIYGACGSAAGWDRDALTYARPPRRRAN